MEELGLLLQYSKNLSINAFNLDEIVQNSNGEAKQSNQLLLFWEQVH